MRVVKKQGKRVIIIENDVVVYTSKAIENESNLEELFDRTLKFEAKKS